MAQQKTHLPLIIIAGEQRPQKHVKLLFIEIANNDCLYYRHSEMGPCDQSSLVYLHGLALKLVVFEIRAQDA